MANLGTVVRVAFLGDNTDLNRKADEAGEHLQDVFLGLDFSQLGDKLGDDLKKAALSVGIGAALVDGITDNLNFEKVTDHIEGRLDLTAQEAERLGKLGADAYRDAWGESIEEVVGVMGRVGTQLVDLDTASDQTLTNLSTRALDIASVWEQDVNQVIRAAETLLSNGLAPSAEAALDIVTRSFQNGGDRAGDLLDTIIEYSQHFAAMGLSGEEAMAMVIAGFEGGQRDADKLADAVKEFSIRAREDTDAVRQAYTDLGLDADELQAKIAEGGPAAREAYEEVVDALLSVEDPLERQRLAVELFGTQMEDLGAEAIQYLRPVADGLGEVEGAAERLSSTINDNAATSIEEFQRKLGAVSDVSTQQAGPAIGFLADIGSDALDVYLELPGAIQGTVGVLGGLTAVALPLIDQAGDLAFNLRNLGEAAKSARAAIGVSSAAGLVGAVGLLGSAAVITGGLYLGFKQTLSGPDNTFQGEIDNIRGLIDQLGELDGTLQFLTAQVEDDELRGLFLEAGVHVDELAQKLNAGEEEWDAYRAAVADAAAETDLNVVEQEALQRILEDLRTSVDGAKEDQRELGDVQSDGAGAAADLADAQLLVAERVTDTTGAVEDHNDAQLIAASVTRDSESAAAGLADAQLIAAQNTRDAARAEEELESAIRDRMDQAREDLDISIARQRQEIRMREAISELNDTLADGNATTDERTLALLSATDQTARYAELVLEAEAANRGLEVSELDASEAAAIQVTELGKVASTLDPSSPLRQELTNYIADILGIPDEVASVFLAQIDEDGFAEVEERLAHLARARDAIITAKLVPGAGSGAVIDDAQLVLAERASGGFSSAGRARLIHADELDVPADARFTFTATETAQLLREGISVRGGGGAPVHVDSIVIHADRYTDTASIERAVLNALDEVAERSGRVMAGGRDL